MLIYLLASRKKKKRLGHFLRRRLLQSLCTWTNKNGASRVCMKKSYGG